MYHLAIIHAQLEIWGKAQREPTLRCKSDWGKFKGAEIPPGSKVTWPEVKCVNIHRTCDCRINSDGDRI